MPASSASHTPSANRSTAPAANSTASRVFPVPPAPVSVTSRASPTSVPSIASSCSRPRKLVSCAGKVMPLPISCWRDLVPQHRPL